MHYLSCIVIRMFAIYFFCIAAGCSSDSVNSGQSSGGGVVQSALTRDINPQASDADLAAVVAGNTEFALKAFPLLALTPNDNTFFSPYSITQAFALLAPGARGITLNEIEQTLSFPLSQDRLNPTFNKLDLLIAGKTTGIVLADGLQAPELNNANSIWGQQGFFILPAYLDTLAVNYGAGLHLVDFINETENSRQTINAWVEEQTNDRIQDLVPQDGVSSATRVVLTNAIWFKASWASQFSQLATSTRPFTNRDGSASSVPFMRQIFMVPYAQVDGCQAIDIPYVGFSLSMLVIMPDPGNFAPFLSALTPTVVEDITKHLMYKEVDFSMPKFSFTKASEMSKLLSSLGMAAAFNPADADFSGIDGKRDLFVGAVFHQAFINVDEVGTEAAAATAIVASPTGSISVDLALAIDHPFVFMIRDRETGLILFIGKVVSL